MNTLYQNRINGKEYFLEERQGSTRTSKGNYTSITLNTLMLLKK